MQPESTCVHLVSERREKGSRAICPSADSWVCAQLTEKSEDLELLKVSPVPLVASRTVPHRLHVCVCMHDGNVNV